MSLVSRKHSPPGAKAEFSRERKACEAAIMAAIDAFEAATGRVVDGVFLKHIDVTQLKDAEPVYVRTAHVVWLETETERLDAERVNEAWRAYVSGKGLRP